MATKQGAPDQDSRKEQDRGQRRVARNRRLSAFAAAAFIGVAAILAVVIASNRQDQSEPHVGAKPSQTPSQTEGRFSVVNVDSGAQSAFPDPGHGTDQLDYTLDGRMVAYSALDDHGDRQVFVMDADGSNQKQLTHTLLGANDPEWSPDGLMIAYWVTLPEGGLEIFVVRITDGVSTRVTHEPRDVYEGSWASDGSFVFSIGNANSTYPLLARSVDLATGETTTIARDVSLPEVSPDGTQVVFDSWFGPGSGVRLSLMNIDGTGRRTIQRTGGDSWAKWSPDGTRIAFVRYGDTYVYVVATGEAGLVAPGSIVSWVDDQHVLVAG